ncbi:heterokaryon incompatibility protein-domain-containing protein [Podospora conica]|nr:heterokaryon incompatibility protein-domain-containing protein [Schizothecium conicum]
MWLINTRTLKLKFFLAPPERYSILSHVWTDEECSFQEFRSLENADEPSPAIIEKKGFKKIQACCKLSLDQGFEWTWIDTCCIDKTSSAELSESINSMFSWYRSSTICYAYLDDITSTSSTKKVPRRNSDSSGSESGVWYSRGWTLQELIAPLHVDFYNYFWRRIGSKWGLRREIMAFTGIGEADLIVFDPTRSSIAQKLSWASHRKTTRVEDEAYCLLGLLGVNMPLLYGEGKKAFRRLQEELIRTSTDHSIFAWGVHEAREGLLAASPRDFDYSNSIRSHLLGKAWTIRTVFTRPSSRIASLA